MKLKKYIKEGIEGSINLKSIYKELNQKFFYGELPNITLKWNGKLKRAVGRAFVRYLGTKTSYSFVKYLDEIPTSQVQIQMNTLKIDISTAFNMQLEDIKAVMLHEMVHILLYTKKKLGDHHDSSEFKNWIKKLREESGYNIPFKESNYKSSPKLQAKEGLALVLYLYDGYGITTYSENFLIRNWLMFAKVVGRIIGKSSRIRMAEMYKVKHPIISSVTAIRNLKKISWHNIEVNVVDEIKKSGKYFFYANKSGGGINPRLIGINANIKPGKELRFDRHGEWINAKEVLT